MPLNKISTGKMVLEKGVEYLDSVKDIIILKVQDFKNLTPFLIYKFDRISKVIVTKILTILKDFMSYQLKKD